MTHARMRELYEHLPGPRRRRIERGDRGADAAGVVVGAGLVLLRDGDFGGGGHCFMVGGGEGERGVVCFSCLGIVGVGKLLRCWFKSG